MIVGPRGCCGLLDDVSHFDSLDQNDVTLITYTRAVQRNLIKGLATYNILQNPVYKDAFGITWKFAVEHKDVNAIRLDKGAADEEDDDAAKADKLQRDTYSSIPFTPGQQHPKAPFFNSAFGEYSTLYLHEKPTVIML